MELLAKSYVDPGDVVVVEAPTYLGAIMAFRGYEADVRGVPVDDAGMRVDVLADLLAGGLRPKIVYTIPDYQNPTGLSMSAERRQRAGRPGPPLRLPDPGGRGLPRARLRRRRRRRACGRWRPTSCCRRARSPRSSRPGSGWAGRRGRREVIGRLVIAKQNSDQCSGALGQRMLEEYGRGGHLDRQIVASRALYERRAALIDRGAGRAHARRHDLDDAATAGSTSGSPRRTASTRWRCPPRPARGRSPTCPAGRSTLATGGGGTRSGSPTAGSPTTSSTRASAGSREVLIQTRTGGQSDRATLAQRRRATSPPRRSGEPAAARPVRERGLDHPGGVPARARASGRCSASGP